jgi:LDH2 family malate/lactate/ureidoglycolate dehydrogenase
MVEIFAGALSGGVCIREQPINQLGNCLFEMVIDPDHVGGGQHFAAEVEGLVKFIRECPRVAGVEEILLPGDPERKSLAKKLAEGISIDEGNWKQLAELGAKLGVPALS